MDVKDMEAMVRAYDAIQEIIDEALYTIEAAHTRDFSRELAAQYDSW